MNESDQRDLKQLRYIERELRRRELPRCPYVAIMIASSEGRGIRLTPEEVASMAADDDIRRSALTALTDLEHES